MFKTRFSRPRAFSYLKTTGLFVCLTLGVVFLLASCTRPSQPVDKAAYANEIEQWRAQRVAGLKSETGWLTLIGLFWLKEGKNTFGSDPASEIVLAKDKVPDHAGTFVLTNGVVVFETSPDKGFLVDDHPVTSLQLKSDADEKPTVVQRGSVSFQIIKRGDKLGVRVRDANNPPRANFPGLEFFPPDPKWRLDARFERYDPPKVTSIVNVLGMESGEPSPGAIAFEIDGKTYRLDAISEKDEPRLFMIFADNTRGKETYGAGRYLYVDPPDANGRVVIDFNKAYSPPCAFTDFATCPLPPMQNILPLAIEAGEKYKGHPGKS